MIDTSHEYVVTNGRFHEDPEAIEPYFATNDLSEAKLAANEIAFNLVILRNDRLDGLELVYDAAFNTELSLSLSLSLSFRALNS